MSFTFETSVDLIDILSPSSSSSSISSSSTLCDDAPIEKKRTTAPVFLASAAKTASLPRRKVPKKKLVDEVESEHTPTPAKISTGLCFNLLSIESSTIITQRLRRNATGPPACETAVPSSPPVSLAVQPPTVIAPAVVPLPTNQIAGPSKARSLPPALPRRRGVRVIQSLTPATATRPCATAPSSPSYHNAIFADPPVVSPDSLDNLPSYDYSDIAAALLSDGCSPAPCDSRPKAFVGSGRRLPIALTVLTKVASDVEIIRMRQQAALAGHQKMEKKVVLPRRKKNGSFVVVGLEGISPV